MELIDVLDSKGNPTGRVVERGTEMHPDEYYLVVNIWLVNSRGEYLISKRTPNKSFCPNMWENTGGFAIAGEDSITAALREVREELGIVLDPADGKRFNRYIRHRRTSSQIADIWVFPCEVEIADIVFQEGETCDAEWADREKIMSLIDAGKFVNRFYLDEFFNR